MSLKRTNLVTAMATLFLLCSAPWLHADHGGDSNITSHALDGLNRFPHVYGSVHRLPNWSREVVEPVEDRPLFSEFDRQIFEALPVDGETTVNHVCPNPISCRYRKVSENEVVRLSCVYSGVHLTVICPHLTPSPVFKFK